MLHDQMGVITTQVMKDHGDKLRNSELQVASIVGCATIFARNVAMVTNAIGLEGFTADVVVCSSLKLNFIFVRHAQWFWFVEDFPYPPFFLFERLQEIFHAIFTSIHHGAFGVPFVCAHDLVSISTGSMGLIAICVRAGFIHLCMIDWLGD